MVADAKDVEGFLLKALTRLATPPGSLSCQFHALVRAPASGMRKQLLHFNLASRDSLICLSLTSFDSAPV